MSTQQQISEIIERRYNNYKGIHWQKLKALHGFITTNLGDEHLLQCLIKCEKKTQIPKYQIPEEILNRIKK